MDFTGGIMKDNKVQIAILGLGTVGTGVYKVLKNWQQMKRSKQHTWEKQKRKKKMQEVHWGNCKI